MISKRSKAAQLQQWFDSVIKYIIELHTIFGLIALSHMAFFFKCTHSVISTSLFLFIELLLRGPLANPPLVHGIDYLI